MRRKLPNKSGLKRKTTYV
jgi:hypothetical protein